VLSLFVLDNYVPAVKTISATVSNHITRLKTFVGFFEADSTTYAATINADN
jgi:hypothetical protein